MLYRAGDPVTSGWDKNQQCTHNTAPRPTLGTTAFTASAHENILPAHTLLPPLQKRKRNLNCSLNQLSRNTAQLSASTSQITVEPPRAILLTLVIFRHVTCGHILTPTIKHHLA